MIAVQSRTRRSAGSIAVWLTGLVVGFGSLQLSGCSGFKHLHNQWEYCECFDGHIAGHRYRWAAHKCWKEYRAICEPCDHEHDFGEGFKDGFYDVAMGGKGCVPALPPRRYWKSCYQNCEGQEKIAAWFRGYPQGALAAMECGYGCCSHLPTTVPGYACPGACQTGYDPYGMTPVSDESVPPAPGVDGPYFDNMVPAVPPPLEPVPASPDAAFQAPMNSSSRSSASRMEELFLAPPSPTLPVSGASGTSAALPLPENLR